MNEHTQCYPRPRELDSTFYKTLLESTKAIPWKIDWKTSQFSYVGPQIEELLGWTAEQWCTVSDWATLIHPEDRDRVVTQCMAQSQDGIDHETDFRALKSDGSYVWIRDVAHVIRCQGEIEALVGFMFDISDRKKNEDELIRLKQELEVLSYQDGLTEIANRRLYDIVLAREWEHATCAQTSISIIMIDLDFFKSCNDRYGHHVGDMALKKVAQILKNEIRTDDLVARVGGEEFVIILPATYQADAVEIAERIRHSIANTPICCDDNLTDCTAVALTASCSVGAIVPQHGDNAEQFISMIDGLLYRAKETGRNRVIVL